VYPMVLYYNKKALGELGFTGAKDPQAMYKAGKWSWDEFEKMAKEIMKLSEPGKFVVGRDFIDQGQHILWSNDVHITTTKNGKVVGNLSDPNFINALTRMQKWFTDKDTFVNIDSARKLTDSKAPITYGMFLAPTPLSLVPSEASDQYVALPPLQYEGQQAYRNTLGSVVRGTFAITSACENPEQMVAWVDYLYTEEGNRLAQAGLEGVEYLFDDDGTWNWIAALEEVSSTVLPNATISDGGEMPGLVSRQFQLDFGHTETHRIMQEVNAFDAHCVEPMPLVLLTDAQQQAISDVHLPIARYAEDHMVYFVTGDIPLNDETWADFCQTVTDKGVDKLISLWQEAIQ